MSLETILTPTSIVSATAGNQADINLTPYKGQASFFLTAYNVAGTSPTLAAKLQSSAPPVLTNTIQTGTTGGTALRTGAAAALKLAASFTTVATVTPSIKSVILPLKKAAGLTSGTLTLEIYADSSGPTGSALCSATFDLSALTTDFSAATFTFTKPYQFAASTKYWLVLSGDYATHATNVVTWRNTTTGTGGNSSVYGTGWVADTTTSLNHSNYALYFSDVAGAAYTSLTTTASVQEIGLDAQNVGYVRLVLTLGGTDSPQYIVACGAILHK